MDSAYKTLLIEQEGPIAILSINRPDKLNAFNPQVLTEFNDALGWIEKEDNIHVLVITGVGEKAFVVGNDISHLITLDPINVYEEMIRGQTTFLRIHELAKPVIAMVNGYALGGGFELALSCDLVVAAEDSRFGFPEINLNTMPGWGGTQLAVKKMGFNRAKEMVLTGEFYSAKDCYDFGFINRLVPFEQLRNETLKLAKKLASKKTFSIKLAKQSLNRAAELSLNAGFQLEAQAYAVNFSAPHAREGLKSFLERNLKKEV